MSKRRIDGVDLSHFQGGINIDWAAAKKAGVRFVYHKATEGTQWIDKSYEHRRAEAADNGVVFGAYHFARPTRDNAVEEAKHFMAFANPVPGNMLPALDLEVNDAHLTEDELTRWVADFFEVVFEHTGVHKGVLYTHFNTVSRPTGVYLWASRYSDSNRNPVVARPFRTWSIWQFSNGQFGSPSYVPGIGHVDIDTLHQMYPWAWLRNLRLPMRRSPQPKTRKPATRVESPIDRLLRIAGSQVGYHEGRSNGHWNNDQKFSKQVPGLGWSNFQAWCATFVSWCVWKAGLADYYPRTASTDAGAKWFKDRGQWSEYPAVGAQVFYGRGGDMMHTGIVYRYDDTFVYAIEGNTNTNGSAEGDGVYRKKRVRRDAYVQGYGYPDIPGVRLKSADPAYNQRSK